MRTLRTAGGAMLASAALAVPAPAAHAVKTFRGKTSQNRQATMTVDDAGMPTRVRFRVFGRCRVPGFDYHQTWSFLPPFDHATTDALDDGGRLRGREGPYQVTASAQLRLKRTFDAADPAAERWSGTFAIRAVFRRNGRFVDTCRTGTRRVTMTLQ